MRHHTSPTHPSPAQPSSTDLSERASRLSSGLARLSLLSLFSICGALTLSSGVALADRAPTRSDLAALKAEQETPAEAKTEAKTEVKVDPAQANTESFASAGAQQNGKRDEAEERLEELRYKHLWIAYSLVWLVVFFFVRQTWARHQAAASRLDELQARLKELESKS